MNLCSLSALAIHYAATENQVCKERMEYMLAELKIGLISRSTPSELKL